MDLRDTLLGQTVLAIEPDHASRDADFSQSLSLVLSDGPVWAELPSGDGIYWYQEDHKKLAPYIVYVQGDNVLEIGYQDSDPIELYVERGHFAGPLVAPTGRMSRVVVEADVVATDTVPTGIGGLLVFSIEQLSEREEAAHGD